MFSNIDEGKLTMIPNRFGITPLVFGVVFLFNIASVILSVHAAFEDQFIGARAYGMAGAYTAISAESDGLLVNPASLSNIKSQQVSATMAMLHLGLSDDTRIAQHLIGYANTYAKWGTIGLLWKRLNVSQLYSENQLVVGASREYRMGSGQNRNLSVGTSLKLLNWDTAPTFGMTGRILEDLPGRSQFSLDLGLVFRSSLNIPIAVSVQNLNTPNLVTTLSPEIEELPLRTTLGIGILGQTSTWGMDLVFNRYQIDVKVGLEYRIKGNKLLLRGGFRLENLAWGTNLAVGAGFKPRDRMRVDYGIVFPIGGIQDTYGSHRFSLVYHF